MNDLTCNYNHAMVIIDRVLMMTGESSGISGNDVGSRLGLFVCLLNRLRVACISVLIDMYD